MTIEINFKKPLTGVILIVALAVACKQEADYKTVRDEVMKSHDVVMADQERIVGNELKIKDLMKDMKSLKSRFPDIDTLKEKAAMLDMLKNLTSAGERMDDWMHEFEPDVTGKPNAAAVQYFENEKAKVASIDSIFKMQIRASGAYLDKFKK